MLLELLFSPPASCHFASFLFYFVLRFVFGCASSLLLCWLFSGCGGQGLPFGCGAQDAGSGREDLSSYGSPALEHRLGSCGAWVSFLRGTPGSEVEPVSPELQADSLPPSHQGRPDAGSPVHGIFQARILE